MKNLRILGPCVVLLLCGSLGLWATQAKKAAAAKTGAATSAPAAAIAVHDYRLEGVQVALTEVTRTAPDVVTVKWEYRNTTDALQKLAADSHGWSDPYRLCWESYLLGSDGKTKLALMRDDKGYPLAAVHGKPVDEISVGPKKTLKTWAKYAVPADAAKVTVVIPGAEPFESVEVTQPGK
jgi:hypothetical protein